MIDATDLNKKADDLSELLQTQLGLRGKTLASRLRKARGILPKRLRNAGQVIVKAQNDTAHPRLASMQDPVPIEAAFRELTSFLKDIDPSERRKTRLLRWLASQVANIIIISGLVILLLRWQDLI